MNGRLGGRDWQGKVFGDIVANSIEVVRSNEGRNATSDDDFGPPPRDLDEPPF